MCFVVSAGVSDFDTLSPLRPKQLFKGNLKDIKVRCKTDLTPRKTLLYNSNKRYKQRTYILNQRYMIAKKRIQKAEEYMLSHKKSINRLNPFTVKFLESQMRLQPQKPRGRRFTIDDKVFALSLYKQSGNAL